MFYDCWRGMVGLIKPTKGSGSSVELIKMLPDGIGVIPFNLSWTSEPNRKAQRFLNLSDKLFSPFPPLPN